MLNNKNILGFTFIELMVAITILVILAVVSFVSYTSYLPGSRDSNRIAQIEEMAKGIQAYKTKFNSLPLPGKYIELTASGKTMGYQGKAEQNLFDDIGYSQEGLDPKDKKRFSYLLSYNRRSFQLMTMLEVEENLDELVFGFINKASANKDYYTDRFPKVTGDKLGILTDVNKTPVEDIISLKTTNKLDLANTEDEYISYISDLEKVTGTGLTLRPIALTLISGKDYISCGNLYNKEKLSHGFDDYYYIKPDGYSKTKIFCDMNMGGGGWTKYVEIKGNYSYEDAKYCVDDLKKIDNENLFCFNPRSLGKIREYLYIDGPTGNHYKLDGINYPYDEITGTYGNDLYDSKNKNTIFDFLTDKSEPDNQFVRFGISYLHNHPDSRGTWEPGGMVSDSGRANMGAGRIYMNYDQGYGKSGFAPSSDPWAVDREPNARLGSFYVR